MQQWETETLHMTAVRMITLSTWMTFMDVLSGLHSHCQFSMRALFLRIRRLAAICLISTKRRCIFTTYDLRVSVCFSAPVEMFFFPPSNLLGPEKIYVFINFNLLNLSFSDTCYLF